MRSIWCSLLLPMFSGLYVCLSIGHDPTNTDEPIEVPFGVWTLVIPRNHVLGWGGGLGLPREGAIFSGTYLGTPWFARVGVLQILNVSRNRAAAMRPRATTTVAACY